MHAPQSVIQAFRERRVDVNVAPDLGGGEIVALRERELGLSAVPGGDE